MLGRIVSLEIKALISLTKSGKNHPMFGKTRNTEVKEKISATQGSAIFVYDSQGSAIFVYDSQGSLVNTFISVRKAVLHFDVSKTTILKYTQNGEIFKEQWKLFFSISEKVNSDNISEK